MGQLSALRYLRVPPASPTPGAARDRPSASQVPRRQQDHRHPEGDGPAHVAVSPASRPLSGIYVSKLPASSPRVPDARRGARPPLGVAGASRTTRSPARSRPSFAASRIATSRTATTSSRRAGRGAVIQGGSGGPGTVLIIAATSGSAQRALPSTRPRRRPRPLRSPRRSPRRSPCRSPRRQILRPSPLPSRSP